MAHRRRSHRGRAGGLRGQAGRGPEGSPRLLPARGRDGDFDQSATNIHVSDGTLQMPLDLANRKIREKIADDYRDEQQRITQFLRKLSAPLLMISNEGDVVDQVRRLLGVPARGGMTG